MKFKHTSICLKCKNRFFLNKYDENNRNSKCCNSNTEYIGLQPYYENILNENLINESVEKEKIIDEGIIDINNEKEIKTNPLNINEKLTLAQSIPLLKSIIDENNINKLIDLKDNYNNEFQKSIKYIGKKYKQKLEKLEKLLPWKGDTQWRKQKPLIILVLNLLMDWKLSWKKLKRPLKTKKILKRISYYLNQNKHEEEYFENNKLHNECGPAKIVYYETGEINYKSYYKHGEVHKENKAATIKYYKNGNISREYYYKYNKLHRDDGPAAIYYDTKKNIKSTKYFINGESKDKFAYLLEITNLKVNV